MPYYTKDPKEDCNFDNHPYACATMPLGASQLGLLAQVCHHVAELCGADEAVAVAVEDLEKAVYCMGAAWVANMGCHL